MIVTYDFTYRNNLITHLSNLLFNYISAFEVHTYVYHFPIYMDKTCLARNRMFNKLKQKYIENCNSFFKYKLITFQI